MGAYWTSSLFLSHNLLFLCVGARSGKDFLLLLWWQPFCLGTGVSFPSPSGAQLFLSEQGEALSSEGFPALPGTCIFTSYQISVPMSILPWQLVTTYGHKGRGAWTDYPSTHTGPSALEAQHTCTQKRERALRFPILYSTNSQWRPVEELDGECGFLLLWDSKGFHSFRLAHVLTLRIYLNCRC